MQSALTMQIFILVHLLRKYGAECRTLHERIRVESLFVASLTCYMSPIH